MGGLGGWLVQAMICWLQDTAYCDGYCLVLLLCSSQEDKEDIRQASHYQVRKNIPKDLPQNPPHRL